MLADRLLEKGIKVTAQTLRSDISALCNDKMDIVIDHKGKNTTYRVVHRDFSLAEIKMICDCIDSSRSISDKQSNVLKQKLGMMCSKHEREEIEHGLFMSARPKTTNEKIFYNIDAIHHATATDSPIQFFYLSWELDKKLHRKYGDRLYEVSPWSLIYDDDCYYMVGYDHRNGIIKHYRVDKMERIEIKHEDSRCGFEAFKERDIKTYSNRHFGMYGGNDKEVTIKCKNNLINVIMDRFGTDTEIIPVDQDYFKFTVSVVVSRIFYSWIFEFGNEAEILEPIEVRNEFYEQIKNLLNKFG